MHRYDSDWNRGYGRGGYGRPSGRGFPGPSWHGGGDWGWWSHEGPRYGSGRYPGARGYEGGMGRGYDAQRRPAGGYGGGYGGGPYGGGGFHGGYDAPWRGGMGYDRFRPDLETPGERWLDEFFDDDDLPEEASGFDRASGGGWGGGLDDGEVRNRVWQCLRDDGYVDAGSIEVDVSDGVVTLRGEVGDYMEARYAWDDAWEAEGVRGVISKLEIRGESREEAPPDAARKAADSPKPKRAPRKSGD